MMTIVNAQGLSADLRSDYLLLSRTEACVDDLMDSGHEAQAVGPHDTRDPSGQGNVCRTPLRPKQLLFSELKSIARFSQ